jgi:GTP cyclohydrolase I
MKDIGKYFNQHLGTLGVIFSTKKLSLCSTSREMQKPKQHQKTRHKPWHN